MSTIFVKDQYRKNPLSLVEGGQHVTVVYEDGNRHVYDKVKNPKAYVTRISKRASKHGEILEVLVESQIVWSRREASSVTQEWLDFLAT